jgi:uncharacterized protein (TIGR02246 family)
MRQRDEIAIRALEAAYDAAWNAGDVRALVASFVPDAVLVNPMGKRATGQWEIARVLGEFLGGAAKGSRHTSVVLGVEFISDDVVLVDGEARLEGLSGAGDVLAPSFVRRFSDVVLRRHGTCLIAQVRAYVFITASE